VVFVFVDIILEGFNHIAKIARANSDSEQYSSEGDPENE
jgi:hypothetical protein